MTQQKEQTITKNHERVSSHGRYIKSIVLGGLDGVVTTFVVVAGATGASLSAGVLLILGLGSLVGDAFSMGVGDYASSASEEEYHEAERRHHEWLFDNDITLEKDKITQVYVEKGMDVDDAYTIADIVTKNKKTAVEVMMLNEHGIVEHTSSAFTRGLYTFFSFLIFGFIPLTTYIIAPYIQIINNNQFLTASIFTGITLFVLGAMKVGITGGNWLLSGVQMLGVGSISATVAYVIGHLLRGLA